MGPGVPRTEGEGRPKPTWRPPRGVWPGVGAVAASRARGRPALSPSSLWFACVPRACIPSAQLPRLMRSCLLRHATFNVASMHTNRSLAAGMTDVTTDRHRTGHYAHAPAAGRGHGLRLPRPVAINEGFFLPLPWTRTNIFSTPVRSRDPYPVVEPDGQKSSTFKEEWHGRTPTSFGMMGWGPCHGKARMASHVERTRHTLITYKEYYW